MIRFLSAWEQKAERNGPVFNTLDAMKFFAIVNMTIDHIGMYLFPEIEWLRALGRITFPVWFFLVGYSRSKTVGKELWIYAVLLVIVHPFVFQPFFPTNALVTIILCRLTLYFLEWRGWTEKYMLEFAVGCIFLSPVTLSFFEYGTVAFLYALIGRLVRGGRSLATKPYKTLVTLAYVTFIYWQMVGFDFDPWQISYVVLGTACVVWWLARGEIRPLIVDWSIHPGLRALTILSRNTLPYYFYHRLLLQILAAWLVMSPEEQIFRWFK